MTNHIDTSKITWGVALRRRETNMPKELSILDENGNDSSDEYFEGRISELKAYLKENFGITEELLREKLEIMK